MYHRSPSSQFDLITAREEFHSSKYNGKGDMSKLLEIFNSKCQNFIDEDGIMDDLEKFTNLTERYHSAIITSPSRTWYMRYLLKESL